tara:strand:- start:53 stop:478 length:426 start_codon:yes stop_codon:yes gene_type:complete
MIVIYSDTGNVVSVISTETDAATYSIAADLGSSNLSAIDVAWTEIPNTLSLYRVIDGEVIETGSESVVIDFSIVNADALQQTRSQRNSLLRQSDWTVLEDSPLTETKKDEWKVYRQTLRDIPQTNSAITDFSEVVWPTEPT